MIGYSADNLITSMSSITQLEGDKFSELIVEYDVEYKKQEDDFSWMVKAKTKKLAILSNLSFMGRDKELDENPTEEVDRSS